MAETAARCAGKTIQESRSSAQAGCYALAIGLVTTVCRTPRRRQRQILIAGEAQIDKGGLSVRTRVTCTSSTATFLHSRTPRGPPPMMAMLCALWILCRASSSHAIPAVLLPCISLCPLFASDPFTRAPESALPVTAFSCFESAVDQILIGGGR